MDIITQINKAVEFAKKKDYKSADKIYQQVYKINPNNPVLLSLMGYLYLSTKKYKKAEYFFEVAFNMTHSLSALAGLVNAKYALEKYEDAVPLLLELIKNEPKYEYYKKLTTILRNFVIFKRTCGYPNLAYEYGCQAIEIFPFKYKLFNDLAMICLYLAKFDEAEKYCQKSLNLNPKNADGLSILGLIYESVYLDNKNAQICYRKSLRYDKKYSTYYNMAYSLSKTCDYSLATRYFKKALKISSNTEAIKLGIAFNYFRQRKFKQGYKYYIQQNDSSDVRKLKKLWDGKLHKNSTVFIYPDLAFGDHIMFMRYVPFLKKYFKKIKVYVLPSLRKIFENNFKEIEFVDKFPKYDYSMALSKLPYYLKMDFDNIPFASGYLSASKADIHSDKLKIGICWEAGNADIRSTIHRTISINELKDIFDIDAEFYSLQVNPSSNDYLDYNMINLGKDFKDFNDTAEAINAMDIIISVDTSVANLAGALGKKTFMLIPYYSDWRWFDNTVKTEWYNSIKLFKQTEKHTWNNEIQRIINELTNLLTEC